MNKYLEATSFIDCNTWSIKGKVQDLTKGQEKDIDKVRSLFYFVRDEIRYNPYSPHYSPEHYVASSILQKREGYCVQKAVLLATLARAVGIPARLRFADIRNYLIPKKLAERMGTDLFIYHGYNELFIEGSWIKATPTFDLRMCQENHIIPVEFDGKNNAILHSHNQDGKLQIEYVRDHGHYQDVPLGEIVDAAIGTYGIEYVERLKRGC
jgi:transglutaminase-like putative cysteine protease